MLRKLIYTIFSVYILSAMTSCNSDTPENHIVDLYSSAEVTAFSIQKNDNILVGLDSVKFSINLKEGLIYNADSLPLGTRINRLLVNITANNASTAEITFRTSAGRDSVVNYLKTTTDSIDFSNAPVKLKIVSSDKTTTMNYTIKVNVHKMKPDSLSWSRIASRNLPSIFNVPAAQKTIRVADNFYCLTFNGEQYCLAQATHPEADEWNMKYVSFGFTPDIESFNGNATGLYILDAAGNLYESTDECETWSGIGGQNWFGIIGGYEEVLVGVIKEGNKYKYTNYPYGSTYDVPEDFPIKGFSGLFEYSTKWSPQKQVIMVGGLDSNMKPVNTTWAYDGKKWGNITSERRLCAAEGMCLVPYYICITDSTNWSVTREEVLLAFGGRMSDGAMNTTTYISSDLGFNWRKAGDFMQLPKIVPQMFNSQAFTVEKTLTETSRTASEWVEKDSGVLPPWYVVSAPLSRASTAITEWNTPYIYMFGGVNNNYTLYNTIWRGVINRLEFKPIQ